MDRRHGPQSYDSPHCRPGAGIDRQSPRNFSGEIDPLQPKALERGFWAFDRDRHELIYLPRLRAALQTSDPEGAIRFRVEVNTKEMRYQLVPTSPYQWE